MKDMEKAHTASEETVLKAADDRMMQLKEALEESGEPCFYMMISENIADLHKSFDSEYADKISGNIDECTKLKLLTDDEQSDLSAKIRKIEKRHNNGK